VILAASAATILQAEIMVYLCVNDLSLSFVNRFFIASDIVQTSMRSALSKAGGSMNDVCSLIIGKDGLSPLHFILGLIYQDHSIFQVAEGARSGPRRRAQDSVQNLTARLFVEASRPRA
jgi:hypothetical protein